MGELILPLLSPRVDDHGHRDLYGRGHENDEMEEGTWQPTRSRVFGGIMDMDGIR